MAAATLCLIIKKETARRLWRQLSQDNRTLSREATIELLGGLNQYFGPSEPIPDKREPQEDL
jgi:hypothetical protein